MIWLLTYKQIECNKNKILGQCIDRLTIIILHVIMEISKYNTYISDEIFLLSLDNKYIADYITA